jgi:hypothetical protein
VARELCQFELISPGRDVLEKTIVTHLVRLVVVIVVMEVGG